MTKPRKIDPGYRDQLDLQRYADRRRQEINEFITKHNPTFMTLFEAKTALESGDPHYKDKIYAVLDPLIVASLSYEPIRLVTKIKEISEFSRNWLIKYWLEKYEIDISETSDFGDWNHKVGLLFISAWYEL